jgi:hypothetical protein
MPSYRLLKSFTRKIPTADGEAENEQEKTPVISRGLGLCTFLSGSFISQDRLEERNLPCPELT